MIFNPEGRAEYRIEEAVLSNYQKLGYSSIYPPVRRVLLYRGAGVVDLVLLPKKNTHRLVLVEAKHSANAESGEKVIGQLLKYYAYALSLGENGLNLLTKFAKTNVVLARGVTKITPQALCGGIHRDLAMPQMEAGRPLQSEEIGLFVAVDNMVEQSLKKIVAALWDYHRLKIGIIQVSSDGSIIVN
jgi:hypothetical protein